MTERSYQEARKLMQHINYVRGIITTAKGEVAKWSKINDIRQTEGTRKALDKALLKLKERREKFAAIKFPDSDLPDVHVTTVDEFEEFR